MTAVLLSAGLACLIGAIVGGGMKGFGVELPLLQSVRRQLLLGLVGVGLLAASAAGPLQTRLSKLRSPQATTATTQPPQPYPAQNPQPITADAASRAPHAAATAAQPGATRRQGDPSPNADVQALRSEIEGGHNRLQVAIHEGRRADCEAQLQRLKVDEHMLEQVLKGLHQTYTPDYPMTHPAPDPCPV